MVFSCNSKELQENITKNIYNFGETQIELKNNNSKYNNILYQINNCNKNKYSKYNIGSQSQAQYADQDVYDILLNYKSNNLASFIIEGKKYDDNEMLKFIYAETEYNSIDSLINKNADFNYILNKDNIELKIKNFQEEESIYYAIISYELKPSDFVRHCQFIDLFNSNTSMYIMANEKGKGKDLITNIKINLKDIKEKCYEINCTLVVYSKSDINILTKVYEPYSIPILEKAPVKEKKEEESNLIKIVIIAGIALVIILVVIIIVCIYFKKKKNNDDDVIEPILNDEQNDTQDFSDHHKNRVNSINEV